MPPRPLDDVLRLSQNPVPNLFARIPPSSTRDVLSLSQDLIAGRELPDSSAGPHFLHPQRICGENVPYSSSGEVGGWTRRALAGHRVLRQTQEIT